MQQMCIAIYRVIKSSFYDNDCFYYEWSAHRILYSAYQWQLQRTTIARKQQRQLYRNNSFVHTYNAKLLHKIQAPEMQFYAEISAPDNLVRRYTVNTKSTIYEKLPRTKVENAIQGMQTTSRQANRQTIQSNYVIFAWNVHEQCIRP